MTNLTSITPVAPQDTPKAPALSGDGLPVQPQLQPQTKDKGNAQAQANPSQKDQGKTVSEAVQTLADFVNFRNYNLNFSVDESSGAMVVKVIDSETKDVIRQIPAEEVLKTAEKIKELQDELGQKIGIFLDKKA
ncbi:flagellar protein FlaG [Gallaecimonas kandeliae]|uniref:flagellar protein FlaG n=1 Tax=Gallaecimonas kandeliae TaxID=3029055 RepID=UPI00264A3FCD|nr:flagellar protein FlaG [Gallaecimonas kandeliae]WKE66719.1 flagellar protein FlaG [Gallaecimonas kandeliae]